MVLVFSEIYREVCTMSCIVITELRTMSTVYHAVVDLRMRIHAATARVRGPSHIDNRSWKKVAVSILRGYSIITRWSCIFS